MINLDYYDGGRLVRVPIVLPPPDMGLEREHNEDCECDDCDEQRREADEDRRFEAWREACHDARREDR